MTGPAKTGHVGTNYTTSLYRSYLSAGTAYLYLVTCIIKPIKFLLDAQNYIAIVYWYKKVQMMKVLKSRQKSCAHMPYFRRPGHNLYGRGMHSVVISILIGLITEVLLMLFFIFKWVEHKMKQNGHLMFQ